jgi:hypothetical protein
MPGGRRETKKEKICVKTKDAILSYRNVMSGFLKRSTIGLPSQVII